jgi:hypothetical protein
MIGIWMGPIANLYAEEKRQEGNDLGLNGNGFNALIILHEYCYRPAR